MEIKNFFLNSEKILVEKSIQAMDFYQAIGITQPGYSKAKKNESINLKTFISACIFLDKSPNQLLSFNNEKSNNENSELLELLRENRKLRIRIEELERAKNNSAGHGVPKLTKQKK